MTSRTGQCLCGGVRYEVRGEPKRVGLCHCADCRKESGSVFTAFAVWPLSAFSSEGEVSVFAGRSFCRECGCRLFNLTGEEAEIRIGGLDQAPTDLNPTYEVWTKRREHWLTALAGRDQFDGDRPSE